MKGSVRDTIEIYIIIISLNKLLASVIIEDTLIQRYICNLVYRPLSVRVCESFQLFMHAVAYIIFRYAPTDSPATGGCCKVINTKQTYLWEQIGVLHIFG